MTAYRRFVALGDSQTEGLNDLDASGTPIGWADRLAGHLAATTSPGLAYANLAVRGCRSHHVLSTQLPVALRFEPDLAAVVVGMNDLLRHDYDLDRVADEVEQCVAALTGAGAQVLGMIFPDLARMLPVMGWLRPRQVTMNDRLREVAARHDVLVLDLFDEALCGDPRMWSHDRIHGSPLGHTRIAAGMAEVMGLPGADPSWRDAPPDAPPDDLFSVVRRDAAWVRTFLAPFLLRQLRGKGTGADGVAKRGVLLPVEPAPLDGDPLDETCHA